MHLVTTQWPGYIMFITFVMKLYIGQLGWTNIAGHGHLTYIWGIRVNESSHSASFNALYRLHQGQATIYIGNPCSCPTLSGVGSNIWKTILSAWKGGLDNHVRRTCCSIFCCLGNMLIWTGKAVRDKLCHMDD